jgi:hypothetical protein
MDDAQRRADQAMYGASYEEAVTGRRMDPAAVHRYTSGRGAVEVTVDQDAYARLLCAMTHPLALSLGTVQPGERCCTNCTLYPVA